jgi:hypothetical protein
MLEVRDPADMHSVVGEVSARCADLFRARAEEQGAAGPRFHTWVKTAAVRYPW